MGRIILIWNEHPSESSATLRISRLIKPLLEKRGHEVEIIKAPMEFEGKKSRKLGGIERDLIIGNFINNLQSQFPDAPIFRIHTSTEHALNRTADYESELWAKPTVVRATGNPKNKSPGILLWRVFGSTTYGIEVPAVYKKAGQNPMARLDEDWNVSCLKSAEKKGYLSDKKTPAIKWHDQIVDPKATAAAGYLSEGVARKIAHLIDIQVNTLKGKYRAPRKPAYKRKQKKPYYRPRTR